jgi:excisionase family DNA binding protein
MITPTKPDPDRQIFSPAEASWYLNISWPTVRKLISQGRICAQRVGRRYLIPRASCDEFISKKSILVDRMMVRLK